MYVYSSTLINTSLRENIYTKPIFIDDLDDGINIDLNNSDSTTVIDNITTDKTPMAPAIKTQPVDEDGNPLEGAKVTLQCKDPKGEFAAVENPAGEYTFKEGIPGDGRIQCDLVVEKEG